MKQVKNYFNLRFSYPVSTPTFHRVALQPSRRNPQ